MLRRRSPRQKSWHVSWMRISFVEIALVMIVGALVGRSGRHMLRGGGDFLEDGFLATLLGVLGAMVTAVIAHSIAGPLNLGLLMLVAAIGTMAFFSLFLATVDRATDRR
jgi:hypothetical protein